MELIEKVVNEWNKRLNEKHSEMQLVPQRRCHSQIIGSSSFRGELDEWASMKLSRNTHIEGGKWDTVGNYRNGNNTACYYFSEFHNRFEVGLRIGRVIASQCSGGAQGLFDIIQNFEETLNNKKTYEWKADKTPYGTIRLIARLNTKYPKCICNCMEELIETTQTSIRKILPRS